jgi:hypothetical protein
MLVSLSLSAGVDGFPLDAGMEATRSFAMAATSLAAAATSLDGSEGAAEVARVTGTSRPLDLGALGWRWCWRRCCCCCREGTGLERERRPGVLVG